VTQQLGPPALLRHQRPGPPPITSGQIPLDLPAHRRVPGQQPLKDLIREWAAPRIALQVESGTRLNPHIHPISQHPAARPIQPPHAPHRYQRPHDGALRDP
jgi:hypothetical protein